MCSPMRPAPHAARPACRCKARRETTQEGPVPESFAAAPRAVKTVRELIMWEYALIIAKAAGFDGNYRFVMSRFQKLKSGEMKWSGIVREDRIQLERGKEACVYCATPEPPLEFDHLIPRARGGPDIVSNLVVACKPCNCSKGCQDIFAWYGPGYRDEMPKLVLAKYLKLVHDFHEQAGTLDLADINGDGRLDIADLGAIFSLEVRRAA